MNRQTTLEQGDSRLLRNLSPLAVWAFSFGLSVGWGSFVMPGTVFLPIAGPLGAAIGFAVGAAIMGVIGVNFHFLMNRYPDDGGTVTYAKTVFGYDYGFLSAWFLGLVYLAILWANATAIPVIFGSLFGDLLHFGFHYVVAGYTIYFGEILVSVGAIVFCALLCLRGCRTAAIFQVLAALLLFGGVLFGFFAVFFRSDVAALPSLQPSFSPDAKPLIGTLFMVFLAPWAFAGFESVSHSVEEFRFSPQKTLRILLLALTAAAAAYILLSLIGAAVRPEGYGSWVDYLHARGELSGIESLPVFHAVWRAAGTPGLIILGVAAACGILTGLVGSMTAASRMLMAMSRDDLFPSFPGRLNRFGAPKNAILLLLAISLPIPFLGRSAIGWIVDVNTIGVTIAYSIVSAAAWKEAGKSGSRLVRVTGAAGALISVGFLIYYLIPLGSAVSLSTESYLMLLSWSVLGFLVFYLLFRADRSRRLGRSTAAWIVLLLLIFFASTVWIIGTTKSATSAAVAELSDRYLRIGAGSGAEAFAADLRDGFSRVTGGILRNSIIQFLLVLVSLTIIFTIYSKMQKSHRSAVKDKHAAEQSSAAKSTFLSNMSHDIRTPMNAIVGYVTLAKREKDLPPRVADYLDKIESSSGHLLTLINDVLEMSRIESGKMELAPIPTDLRKLLDETRSLFSTQMETKGLRYTVRCDEVRDAHVLCDQNRMNRVLLNLISNAYKFTPAGGTVDVCVRQTGRAEGSASYELRVKDSGIGMSPEFAAKVFEAYAREKTSTVENIQGTGLGTAITKSIVELMGGTIEVLSEKGKGSEFIVRVDLPLDPAAAEAAEETREGAAPAFAGLRALLVEDDAANREVEKTLLEEMGFVVETAVNGEDAVETVAASAPGEFAVVLMDVEMPVKNGYETTKLIRSLKNRALASIPIVALTAKAFSEDVAAAMAAGMNAHIAKPIDAGAVSDTLSEVLRQ
ncbi:MAG: amino acid permease [Oscillospiraceae bacterium]|nr:amino acid permease [Oscillospiraceae bacterium]